MITAVIFDMDGVLIDSEPLWRRAEIQTFADVGIAMTEDMCRETTGLRLDEIVAYWHRRFPWAEPSQQSVQQTLLANVVQLVRAEGTPLDGVYECLRFVHSQGVKLALASSSAMELIRAVVGKLQLAGYFDVIVSADSVDYGKPHPAVYLTTARRLACDPARCLAIEDSINGIVSAKAARMTCVAVPDAVLRGDKRLGIADVVISSLSDLDQRLWNELDR